MKMENEVVLRVRKLNVFYGAIHAVKDVEFDVEDKNVTAMIGPSACGKTTMLRAVSRNLDSEKNARITGEVIYRGQDIYAPDTDPHHVRKNIRYISQVPNLFDMTVLENLRVPLTYWFPDAPRSEILEKAERSLARVMLDTKGRDLLEFPARSLSAGEQQKLALARGLCDSPDVLLLDEPTANMDPISAMAFEEVIDELRAEIAVLIITHSMQQAARVSQKSAMVHLGVMSEFGDTSKIFTNPDHDTTQRYITGRFG